MPFDEVTGKAAKVQFWEDKEASDDIISEKLKDARHMKKLYDSGYDALQETFKIDKGQHRNYPIPNKTNLNLSNSNYAKPSKYNRGHHMVKAALSKMNKI